MLTILYKHFIDIKALDALNQELFQLLMADKETVLDWPSWNTTASPAGYPNVLKTWWPTLRSPYMKRPIPITCRLQWKQRRKTQWGYPKAHKAKQPITPPDLGQLVSCPCRSSRGPSLHLKHPPYTWHTWKRRVPRKTKMWKVKTLTAMMWLWRSSWCALWGLWRMPKWRKSTVLIVAVWSTSSMTAH